VDGLISESRIRVSAEGYICTSDDQAESPQDERGRRQPCMGDPETQHGG